jgi:hypothetical protein
MLKHAFVQLHAEKTRKKKHTMMIFVIFVALLVTLDLAAMIWGFESRDGMDSLEWQRRAHLAFPSHRASSSGARREALPGISERSQTMWNVQRRLGNFQEDSIHPPSVDASVKRRIEAGFARNSSLPAHRWHPPA